MQRAVGELMDWQKARQSAREIGRITRCPEFRNDRAPANQPKRAAVSVMSSVAENGARNNHGETERFLVIARVSCGEVRSQL